VSSGRRSGVRRSPDQVAFDQNHLRAQVADDDGGLRQLSGDVDVDRPVVVELLPHLIKRVLDLREASFGDTNAPTQEVRPVDLDGDPDRTEEDQQEDQQAHHGRRLARGDRERGEAGEGQKDHGESQSQTGRLGRMQERLDRERLKGHAVPTGNGSPEAHGRLKCLGHDSTSSGLGGARVACESNVEFERRTVWRI
jgi:hypothetical protein